MTWSDLDDEGICEIPSLYHNHRTWRWNTAVGRCQFSTATVCPSAEEVFDGLVEALFADLKCRTRKQLLRRLA